MEQETKKYENVSASERKKYAEELKKIIAKIREDQIKKESPLYGDGKYGWRDFHALYRTDSPFRTKSITG